MLLYRFPWVWGPTIPSTPTPTPVTPPVWSAVAPGAQSWEKDAAQLLPRFQHLYPQDSDLGWTKKESP